MGSILVLAVAFSTMVSFKYSEKLLTDQASTSMLKTLKVSSEDLKASLSEVAKDAQLISSGAAVQNLIEAKNIHPDQYEMNREYQIWQSNMERLFTNMIKNKGYLQVRFIGMDDGGKELVRVDAPELEGQPVVIKRGSDLQKKGHRNYVQVGTQLQPYDFYISSISLNREMGKIQQPWQPTQRFVSPVYLDEHTGMDQTKELVGVIVINSDASKVISELARESQFDLILVTDEGGILHHNSKELCWKFEFDKTAVLQKIEPHAWRMLTEKFQGVDMTDSHGHAHATIQVPLGDTGDHYLGIILSPRREELFATAYNLKKTIETTSTVFMIAALFISMLLVRFLVSPIKNLTRQAELVTAGEIDEITFTSQSDEVGRLGQSFAKLIIQLKKRQNDADEKANEVFELNKTLEDKVTQRTQALENSQIVLQQEAATKEALNKALGLSLYAKTPADLLLGALDTLLALDFLAIESQSAAFIVDGKARELTLVAERNLARPLKTLCAKVPFGKCYCGQAAEEKNIIFKSCVDINHHIDFEGMEPHGHYNVPLIDGADVVGVLALYLPSGAQKNEMEIEFLKNFSDILAGALRRMKVESDLETARQEAEMANQSKSDFLANMSHEIRTPMTAILGYTDILNEHDLVEKERINHVNTIKQNGNHLLTIINDILDVSKIESGKMEIENIPVMIWEIVAEVKELLQVKAKDRGNELVADFKYPLPEFISSDPVRLRQIMLNLMGNSIKFTENGKVSIAVSMVDEKLQFAISDTGIGMTPEQAQKLFKPFSQADSSTTRKFGGTGLGLTISKHLSELMGGCISLESEYQQGSTFTVQIDPGDLKKTKLVYQEPQKSSSQFNDSQLNPKSLFKGRILLAEDTLVNQKLAVRILTKAGNVVETADNGQEALNMALDQWRKETPYDVILMDMQMPVMDGYQATGKLRAANYPWPIVALTANAMASDREKCLQAGCDDFATKPFQKVKLLRTISHWIEKSQSLLVSN